MNETPRPGVFLDRDGVLIENVSTYVRRWDEVEIYPYSVESLRRLKEAGLPVFVITNQSIVGRGGIDFATIDSLHQKIMEAVDPHHAVVKSYLCPHAPEENCDCRKPQPGSLFRAAKEFNIDLDRSFMVGDAVSDVLAARAAGVKPLIVKSGRGLAQIQKMELGLAEVTENLETAVSLILAQLPHLKNGLDELA